jgi:uncharacterized protein (TIGR00730 family)
VRLRAVCVFCGSSTGARPAYADAARALGALLAGRGTRLVYGGGDVGLMGIIADAALAAGGEVIGVIPRALADLEIAHTRLTKLHVVSTMHERKQQMHDLSDGFIALPGGLGTLEEFFEVLTWGQLGMHAKPCGILDVEGYYEPMLRLLDRAVDDGLLKAENRAMLIYDTDAEQLLQRMTDYRPPTVGKWIGRAET